MKGQVFVLAPIAARENSHLAQAVQQVLMLRNEEMEQGAGGAKC